MNEYAELDHQFNKDFTDLLRVLAQVVYGKPIYKKKITLEKIARLYSEGIPSGQGSLRENVISLKRNFVRYRVPTTEEINEKFARCELFTNTHPDYCLPYTNSRCRMKYYLFIPEIYTSFPYKATPAD